MKKSTQSEIDAINGRLAEIEHDMNRLEMMGLSDKSDKMQWLRLKAQRDALKKKLRKL